MHLRAGTPAQAGLQPQGLRDVEALLEAAIADGAFPGAVGLIARGETAGWHVARGDAQVVPRRRAAALDTLYDLASVTKVAAALPVALAMSQRGRFALDDPVSAVIPEFAGGERGTVTFRHLLAHTSGLPAWKALYLEASSADGMLAALCRTPLAASPGAVVEYSDLGILLLGAALERLGGRRIDQVVADHVVRPLDLHETMYTPPERLRPRCAATEVGNAYERGKVGPDGAGFRWREEALCGEVHDGNAHYGLQGIAPHAGLFSTAWEVATIGLQWLRGETLVTDAARREATRDQRRGAIGHPRGLGWVLHHPGAFFEALGPRSFGHSGFTGTSLAVDPDDDLLVVLLTNRVHFGGENTKIQDVRLRFHAAVRRAAGR